VNLWSSIMATDRSSPTDHKTAAERRKNLTDEQIKDLELAGGVEGGMQAGSAGGPGASAKSKCDRADAADQVRHDKA
jgi:hypothetical protein